MQGIKPSHASLLSTLPTKSMYTCDALISACILSITVHTCIVHTMKPAFYCSLSIHMTLVHSWAPHFVIHCLCMCDAHTYHCLLPVLDSLMLTPTITYWLVKMCAYLCTSIHKKADQVNMVLNHVTYSIDRSYVVQKVHRLLW